MTNISHAGWLNQNELRKYPFAEDASLASTASPTGAATVLPNYVVVDFLVTLASYPGSDATYDQIYLRRFSLLGDLVAFEFAARRPATETEEETVVGAVFGGSVRLSEHVPYKSYPLGVSTTGDFAFSRGRLVLGDLRRLLSDGFAMGDYLFTYETAEISPATVRPGIDGVSSLRVPAPGAFVNMPYGDFETVLTGHVRLVGDNTINLKYVPAANAIVFSQRTPDPEKDCECAETAVPIRTINGVPPPTDDGNIMVVGDECIEIDRASANTLTIRNVCAKPCCGCEELQFLSSKLSALRNAVTTLDTRSTQLEASIAAADAQITRLMYW